MNDIKCPHCDKAFKIDESGYANILKQVRDREFDQEVNKAVEQSVKLANQESQIKFLESIAKKDSEIESLAPNSFGAPTRATPIVFDLNPRKPRNAARGKVRNDAQDADR